MIFPLFITQVQLTRPLRILVIEPLKPPESMKVLYFTYRRKAATKLATYTIDGPPF